MKESEENVLQEYGQAIEQTQSSVRDLWNHAAEVGRDLLESSEKELWKLRYFYVLRFSTPPEQLPEYVTGLPVPGDEGEFVPEEVFDDGDRGALDELLVYLIKNYAALYLDERTDTRLSYSYNESLHSIEERILPLLGAVGSEGEEAGIVRDVLAALLARNFTKGRELLRNAEELSARFPYAALVCASISIRKAIEIEDHDFFTMGTQLSEFIMQNKERIDEALESDPNVFSRWKRDYHDARYYFLWFQLLGGRFSGAQGSVFEELASERGMVECPFCGETNCAFIRDIGSHAAEGDLFGKLECASRAEAGGRKYLALEGFAKTEAGSCWSSFISYLQPYHTVHKKEAYLKLDIGDISTFWEKRNMQPSRVSKIVRLRFQGRLASIEQFGGLVLRVSDIPPLAIVEGGGHDYSLFFLKEREPERWSSRSNDTERQLALTIDQTIRDLRTYQEGY